MVANGTFIRGPILVAVASVLLAGCSHQEDCGAEGDVTIQQSGNRDEISFLYKQMDGFHIIVDSVIDCDVVDPQLPITPNSRWADTFVVNGSVIEDFRGVEPTRSSISFLVPIRDFGCGRDANVSPSKMMRPGLDGIVVARSLPVEINSVSCGISLESIRVIAASTGFGRDEDTETAFSKIAQDLQAIPNTNATDFDPASAAALTNDAFPEACANIEYEE